MGDSGSNASGLIIAGDGGTREFHQKLSALEKGSEKWKEYLWSNCDSDNNLIQVTAFQEIGKSGDPSWLPPLLNRLNTETVPTNLGAIFCAIGELGGLNTREDYSHFFKATDDQIRGAAMQMIYFLPPEDAIELLLEILEQDPDLELRKVAAERLAYLGSDAGLPLLLDGLKKKRLNERIQAACALALLNNPVGLGFLHQLIKTHLILSKQDRSSLLFALLKLLNEVGMELPPCDKQDEITVETIFQKAANWIETRPGWSSENQWLNTEE